MSNSNTVNENGINITSVDKSIEDVNEGKTSVASVPSSAALTGEKPKKVIRHLNFPFN